ncbi:MAG: threonine/serine exporter family protein [Defluviitaleaceae bacterium]|nr:threonine/serine exporter family protein [Defluviitaleaceae bacterium]MCL2837001.1 threonine/serine exporter family protein [Defluviitaleaceae bacterium]
MNPNEAIKLSITAGEIMLSNGAETYRVEDTMKRMLRSCGYHSSEAFVVSTGVFITVNSESGDLTSCKRIIRRSFNVDTLIKMNDISRSFADGRLTAESAYAKMEELRTAQPIQNYTFMKLFCAGIACGCFTYLFGGGPADCLNAFFTGFILKILLIQLRKSRVSEVLCNIIGGVMISFLTLTLLNLGVGRQLDYIIIGSLMLLVPGLTLTNAVRDVLEGDYLSGSARLMDAVTVAICIATGVGTALKVWFHIFGGAYI